MTSVELNDSLSKSDQIKSFEKKKLDLNRGFRFKRPGKLHTEYDVCNK